MGVPTQKHQCNAHALTKLQSRFQARMHEMRYIEVKFSTWLLRIFNLSTPLYFETIAVLGKEKNII